MKIAVISDQGVSGGAGIAATRLCRGLLARGHAVARYFGAAFPPPPSGSATIFSSIQHQSVWTQRFSTVLKNERMRQYLQKKWCAIFREKLNEFRPDIINIHNLHSMGWDIEIVEECLRIAPVVWTMHDMWPITGSCAHSLECAQYLDGCTTNCPRLGIYPTLPSKMIPAAHQRRQKLYVQRPKLVHVAPSKWLTQCAHRMNVGFVPTRTIGNSTAMDIYRPCAKVEIRNLLCLPDDKKPCLLTSASDLNNVEKGLPMLLDALALLKDQQFRLILMGQENLGVTFPENVEVVPLGAITGDRFIALATNAADVLVHPSHADNQPLVVIEAMACGLPVVALPVGGVPEMVQNEMTGWVAKNRSIKSLAEAIRRAIAQRNLWPLYRERCRSYAEKYYPIDLQARRYEKLFADYLKNGMITPQEDLDAMAYLKEDDTPPSEQPLQESLADADSGSHHDPDDDLPIVTYPDSIPDDEGPDTYK